MERDLDDKAAPFDRAAAEYDRMFTGGVLARVQREAVWRRLDGLLRPGARVLELGCGTGEDAVRLARRGIEVVATDVSAAMLEATRRKAAAAGVGGLVTVSRLDLSAPAGGLAALGGRFDGALSDFGPLNCMADRRPLARALARLLPAGAPLVVVLLGTLCPWEICWYLLHRSPAAATRRFRSGRPATVGGGGVVTVWYPPPRTLRRETAPWFRLAGVEGLGVLLPPPALEHLARRRPRLVARLGRAERRIAHRWPFNRLGDHTLLELERTDAGAGAS